jgi:hypothetical protein
VMLMEQRAMAMFRMCRSSPRPRAARSAAWAMLDQILRRPARNVRLQVAPGTAEDEGVEARHRVSEQPRLRIAIAYAVPVDTSWRFRSATSHGFAMVAVAYPQARRCSASVATGAITICATSASTRRCRTGITAKRRQPRCTGNPLVQRVCQRLSMSCSHVRSMILGCCRRFPPHSRASSLRLRVHPRPTLRRSVGGHAARPTPPEQAGGPDQVESIRNRGRHPLRHRRLEPRGAVRSVP